MTDDQMDKKVKELEALLRIGQRLSSEMNLDRLLEMILDETTSAMEADRSSLFLVDSEKQELWSKIAQASAEIRLPIGKGIAGAVAKTGKIINIRDAYADKRFNREVDKRTGYRTRSILCVPMKNVEGRIIGVIQVLNKKHGVFDDLDEEMLLALAGEAAVAVDNARYHQESLAQERLKKDLEFARTIQKGFLPSSPPRAPGWNFAAQYRPAQEVGGDFYDFIPLSEDQMGVLIGDVSGKGVPAALYMARLMSDFRFYATALSSPGEVVGQINQILVERSRRGMFVTLCYILLDLAEGKLTMVNAGHLSPLIRKSSGRVVPLEGTADTPLGILEDQTFAEIHSGLESGESLALITDGIIEAKNREGAMFGEKRLKRTMASDCRTASKSAGLILDGVIRFSKGAPQHDDLTLVCLRRHKRALKRGKGKKDGVKSKEDIIRLQVKSDPRYLALVRRNLEFMLVEDKVLDREIQKIVLAVDEAAANVIRYAYEGNKDQIIDFGFEISPEWLTIRIRDYGKKPDPAKIKPRDLDDIRPGGLGTRFIREVMDEVDYDVSPEIGTLLTMKKRRLFKQGGKRK
jgi:sigma-B regulation protein RsbU (phosphoserine phosphatase)